MMYDLPKWLRVTTDVQREAIEKLAKDHREELVYFGGEMYRHGLIDSMFYIAAGFAFCYIVRTAYRRWKKNTITKNEP